MDWRAAAGWSEEAGGRAAAGWSGARTMPAATEPAAPPARPPDQSAVGVMIGVLASAAAVGVGSTASGAWHAAETRPAAFLTLLALTFALQLVSVDVYGRGTISFQGTGMLALGFTFGAGAAMTAAVLMGVINGLKRRPAVHKAVFDLAQWTLAAGVGTATYETLG